MLPPRLSEGRSVTSSKSGTPMRTRARGTSRSNNSPPDEGGGLYFTQSPWPCRAPTEVLRALLCPHRSTISLRAVISTGHKGGFGESSERPARGQAGQRGARGELPPPPFVGSVFGTPARRWATRRSPTLYLGGDRRESRQALPRSAAEHHQVAQASSHLLAATGINHTNATELNLRWSRTCRSRVLCHLLSQTLKQQLQSSALV